MYTALQKAARRAGVEGVGVHTLRHSAAVAWLENGVHIKAVADLLGHSSIRHHRRHLRPHFRHCGACRHRRPRRKVGAVSRGYGAVQRQVLDDLAHAKGWMSLSPLAGDDADASRYESTRRAVAKLAAAEMVETRMIRVEELHWLTVRLV
jgi:hypothetical protein